MGHRASQLWSSWFGTVDTPVSPEVQPDDNREVPDSALNVVAMTTTARDKRKHVCTL